VTSWLQRLLARKAASTIVRRSEYLNLTVPTAKADAVRAAVESWLESHGIETTVHAELLDGGKTRLKASVTGPEAAKLDLADAAVQSELQDVIANAVSSGQSSS
jgi:hypothetical protein